MSGEGSVGRPQLIGKSGGLGSVRCYAAHSRCRVALVPSPAPSRLIPSANSTRRMSAGSQRCDAGRDRSGGAKRVGQWRPAPVVVATPAWLGCYPYGTSGLVAVVGVGGGRSGPEAVGAAGREAGQLRERAAGNSPFSISSRTSRNVPSRRGGPVRLARAHRDTVGSARLRARRRAVVLGEVPRGDLRGNELRPLGGGHGRGPSPSGRNDPGLADRPNGHRPLLRDRSDHRVVRAGRQALRR